MSRAIIDNFWRWFQEREEELFDEFDPALPSFHQLVKRLREVHPKLVVDVATKKRGMRTLIVSGDGHRDAFPMVLEMVEAAPALSYWDVRAFRPARDGHMNVVVNGVLFETSNIFFYLERQGDKVDVQVWFIDEASLGENHSLAAETLLMNLLGEYVYVTRVREITVHVIDQTQEYSDLQPMVFVRNAFEELYGGAGN